MKYKKVLPHVFFVILVGLFVFINNPTFVNHKTLGVREKASVTQVIDGDTIKILISNKEEVVRLIGIDSPEIKDESKPVQCFGKEASIKAKEILTGKTIVLESDPTQENRDEYGRLLRYVFLEDGTSFNKLMISGGYSREYTFKGRVYRYQSEFIQAEKEARESRVGLWLKCNKI